MRKQFKSALSMVLSAAMVLSLGSGITLNTASADETATYPAHLVWCAGSWGEPQSWNPDGDGDVGVTSSNAAITLEEGTKEYTVSIKANEGVSSTGITVFTVDINGLDTAAKEAGYNLSLDGDVKISRDGQDETVKQDKIQYGDLESNGNFRIALYNETTGQSGEDAAVASDNFNWSDTLAVTFSLKIESNKGTATASPAATASAPAVSASPSPVPAFNTPVPKAHEYHAYLGFQTGTNWLVRDAWCSDQSAAAKKKFVNGYGLNEKKLVFDDKTETPYDFKTQFYKTGSGTAPYATKGAYTAKFEDATITDNGKEYSVKMSGADFSGEAAGYNMLYISTDIATTQTAVKFSDAKIIVDGKQVATVALKNKSDAAETYGYYQMMAINMYGNLKDGTKVLFKDIKGMTMQKDSIELKFTVSGIDFTKTQQVNKIEAVGVAKGKTFTSGNLKYKVTKGATKYGTKVTNGTVTVVGLSKAGKKKATVSVPATVSKSGGKYKVSALGTKAFAKASKLKTVKLNKYMKKIPAKAFINCKKLSKLVLKVKITSVKKGAFKGCKKKITVSAKKSIKKASLKKLKKSGYKKFK